MNPKSEKRTPQSGHVTVIAAWPGQVVVDDNGQEKRATIRGASRQQKKSALVVGDKVVLGGSDQALFVEKQLTRKSLLARKDPDNPRKTLLLAANADMVLCIVGRDTQRLNHGFIDRCITAAAIAGMDCVIVLNKSDLRQPLSKVDEELLQEYQRLGFEVLKTSAIDGSGLGDLRTCLDGTTAAMVGLSGAGKTSLLNRLVPNASARTVEVREDDSRGRHTTTSARMYITSPFRLVDLPGIREFGISADSALEIRMGFPELDDLRCRFSDCSHSGEPGCGLPDIRMHPLRRQSLIKLMAEADGQSAADRKLNWRLPRSEGMFECSNCGVMVALESGGTANRNHCPSCLHSLHLDNTPGDRASGCGGIMDPVALWVRNGPEWAIIHRCRRCGALSSNRIASDDNEALLLSIAVRPLSSPAFPLDGMHKVG